MTANIAENEEERNRKNPNIDKMRYRAETLDSDILFYVKGLETELSKVNESLKLNTIQQNDEDLEPMYAPMSQKMKFSELKKYPIRKDDFNKIISKLNSAFNELLKNDGPNPNEPQARIEKIKGYSLEEIELNLNIEAGATILFSLNTKGSAGVKLVFKRNYK